MYFPCTKVANNYPYGFRRRPPGVILNPRVSCGVKPKARCGADLLLSSAVVNSRRCQQRHFKSEITFRLFRHAYFCLIGVHQCLPAGRQGSTASAFALCRAAFSRRSLPAVFLAGVPTPSVGNGGQGYSRLCLFSFFHLNFKSEIAFRLFRHAYSCLTSVYQCLPAGRQGSKASAVTLWIRARHRRC